MVTTVTATAWQTQQLKAVSSLFKNNKAEQPPDTGCSRLLLYAAQERFFSGATAIFFPAAGGFVIYKPSLLCVKVNVCVPLLHKEWNIRVSSQNVSNIQNAEFVQQDFACRNVVEIPVSTFGWASITVCTCLIGSTADLWLGVELLDSKL